MNRKRMMELVDERMGLSKNPQPGKKDAERTGKETLELLLADDEPEAQEPESPVQPKIILYLRDDVNPAEKNFTKNPNEMYDLAADKLTSHETVLYMWAWRMSWGFGRNYCRFSRRQVLNKTSINSESSVRRAITGLREKQFIIQVLNEHEKPELNRSGSLYRICNPLEIASGKVEEGILLGDIPLEGVYCTQLNMARLNKSRTTMNPVQYEPSQIEPAHNEPTGQLNMTRLNMTSHRDNPDDTTTFAGSAQIEPGHDEPALKDRHSIKDSLSPDPVKLFYTGIGQQRISKQKRERGNSILQELEKDGFSKEDIQFAIEWTLEPGNTKEKVHDFSIISHTIGQALSARDADEEAAENARKEDARVRAAEEEQGRLEGEIKDLRSKLNDNELAELRKQAEREIRDSGKYKEQFINEPLIVAKENEILRRKI